MIPQVKNENELRKLAGLPLKEMGESLDNILAKHREAFESVMMGQSMLYDHDNFFDELYDWFVNSGEMPYGIAKAREGDPDQWIQEYLEQEYGDDFATDDVDQMDGDFDSGMASAGMGTDEDYGHYGEGINEYGRGTDDKGNKFYITKDNKKFADEKTARDYEMRNPNLSWPKSKKVKEHHEKDADGNPIPHKKPETFKEHLEAVKNEN